METISFVFESLFGEETVLLPDGEGRRLWACIQRDPEHYPHISQFWITLPVALLILLIREVFNYCVTRPIAKRYHISDKENTKPKDNPTLEAFFRQNKRPKKDDLQRLAKETSISEAQVNQWFKKRRMVGKPNKLTRLSDAMWRFTYYTIAFSVSIAIMLQRPWLYDTTECWKGWPDLELDFQIRAIYIFQESFYLSLILAQFFEYNRKDFWEMFIHHIATLLLIAFSWHVNFVRIGTLVLLVHDVADIFLESAKIANYLKYKFMTDALFVTFAIVFFISRLVVYPLYVIRSAFFESLSVNDFPIFSSWILFQVLLITLLILHIFWFRTIVKIAIGALSKGKTEDIRSDSEDDEDEHEHAHESTEGVESKKSK